MRHDTMYTVKRTLANSNSRAGEENIRLQGQHTDTQTHT